MFGWEVKGSSQVIRRSLQVSLDYTYAHSLNEGYTAAAVALVRLHFVSRAFSRLSSSNSSEVESIRERNVVDPAKRRILKCIMGAGLGWAALALAAALHAFPPLL